MSSQNRIEKGDEVIVNFMSNSFTLMDRGEVLHVPLAAGECWIIKDKTTNSLHYISEGCSIIRLANV